MGAFVKKVDLCYSFLAYLKTWNLSDAKCALNKKTKTKRQTLVSDSTKTLRICTQINRELTHIQKIIVIVNLLEMIATGNNGISESENDFITTTVDIFNISKSEFESIQSFILSNKRAQSQ